MIDPQGHPAPRRASALRASALGGAVALAIAALAAVAGLVPEGLGPVGFAGVGSAVLAALLAAFAHARIVAPAPVDRVTLAASAHVTRALALGFLAKVLVLAVGLGVLWVAGMKFSGSLRLRSRSRPHPC
jgi:hypothetical protein